MSEPGPTNSAPSSDAGLQAGEDLAGRRRLRQSRRAGDRLRRRDRASGSSAPSASSRLLISRRNQPPMQTPVLPPMNGFTPNGCVEFVPQRLTAAGIDPGDMLVRRQPERHRGVERRRRLLALPEERRGVRPSRRRRRRPRPAPRRPAPLRPPRDTVICDAARPDSAPMRSATRSADMPGPGSRFGHDVTMRQRLRLRARDRRRGEPCGERGCRRRDCAVMSLLMIVLAHHQCVEMMHRPVPVADRELVRRAPIARGDIILRVAPRPRRATALGEARGDGRRQRAAGAVRVLRLDALRRRTARRGRRRRPAGRPLRPLAVAALHQHGLRAEREQPLAPARCISLSVCRDRRHRAAPPLPAGSA